MVNCCTIYLSLAGAILYQDDVVAGGRCVKLKVPGKIEVDRSVCLHEKGSMTTPREGVFLNDLI